MFNEIFEFKTEIPLETDYPLSVEKTVNDLFQNIDQVYSYFVGRKNDIIVIKVCQSATDEYNTIDKFLVKDDIITKIIDYIITLSDAKCIAFGQPPLDLIILLYKPMLDKMADKINVQWPRYEHEDLVSIGYYSIVKLYKQGFYLNKALIWTTFNNEVLLENRKRRNEPDFLSLDTSMKRDVKIDDEELTYGDLMKDETYEEEKEQEDEQQLEKYVFDEVKSIIIDKIGQRQWDRLWRDYSKEHTSVATRQCMNRLKGYFKELGLTRQDFVNHYRR